MFRRFVQVIEDIEGRLDSRSAPSSVLQDSPRYLAAVSGGADSMCLADLCLKTFGHDGFAVAHCNFHLRGAESDGDEALVASWAIANDVEMHRIDFDTLTYAREKGISIEMAARDLRYEWFASLCSSYGFRGVMTAHNANDNAETMFLNILRGAGLHGICGMDEISSWSKMIVLRPLLSFTRKQIEGYALSRQVAYRDDSTNSLSDYKRNRIRNEVFPHFEKINPSFIRTVNREMKYFSEADEIIDDWCEAQAEQLVSRLDDGSCVKISISSLLSVKHWKYVLYHILYPYGFHSAVLASIEDLLSSGRTISGKRFESDTHSLMTGRDELVIRPSALSGKALHADDPIMVVRGEGLYRFNGLSFKVEILPWSSDMPLRQQEGTIIFDAASLSFPFICRRWNMGDWFRPLGMKGRKKVSDLFADLKYDSIRKDASVMVVDCSQAGEAECGHVAGILGVRIDERYKVLKTTESIIRMTITYEDHEE